MSMRNPAQQFALSPAGASAPTQAASISGASFGLVPNTGRNMRGPLMAALRAARTAGKPVLLQPGEYRYSGGIMQGNSTDGWFGGGLVCFDGRARMVCDDPDYAGKVLLDLFSPNNGRARGLWLQGVDFYHAQRPDSGLSNDATENAVFVRITNFDDIWVWGNSFSHNYGGGCLIRSCRGGLVAFNEFDDVWKDNLHITGSCDDITVAYNHSYGAGDDAFAIVGVAAGVPTESMGQPSNIRVIKNRAYGVRRARGFAVVGARDVTLEHNYVNGTLPDWIPQKQSSTGEVYNTACALIIASEDHAGDAHTYGNENIRVIGHEAENISPGRWAAGATGGTPGNAVSTLSAITINNAMDKSKNISVQASVRNSWGKILIASGGYATEDLTLDITAQDNSGNNVSINGQTYTQTSGSTAIDLQNVTNMDVRLRCDDLAANAISLNSACRGRFKFFGSIGKVNQLSFNTNLVSVDTSVLEFADVELDFREIPGAQNSQGSIGNLVRLNGGAYSRDIRITGVQSSAWNNGSPFTGLDSRSGATPSSAVGEMSLRFVNVGTRRQFLHYTGGTVSGNAIKYAAIGLSQVVAISGSTITLRGNVADRYPTGATLYWANSMGQLRAKEDKTFTNGQSLTMTTHASTAASVNSDGNTVITLTAAPPTDLALGMWVLQLSTNSTDTGKAWPMHTIEPGQVVVQTFSANPPAPTIFTAQR
jgi:hypothetical protein